MKPQYQMVAATKPQYWVAVNGKILFVWTIKDDFNNTAFVSAYYRVYRSDKGKLYGKYTSFRTHPPHHEKGSFIFRKGYERIYFTDLRNTPSFLWDSQANCLDVRKTCMRFGMGLLVDG